jgi:hypothetical protein
MLAILAVTAAFAGDEPLTEREKALLDRIEQLEKRVSELEAKVGVSAPPSTTASLPAPVSPVVAPTPPAPAATPAIPGVLRGTTVNFLLDAYYGYNFNDPIGRDNLLRAYDVLSNAFSLSQATVVLENTPDLSKGKRFGARLDLQFGQATQTLQGNPANEPRPGIYRNIFQAYGTYVFPVGSGLTVDVGKWASSLGYETNYPKDNMNYSRSFWFDFLPFYHMGARVNYKVNDRITLNYWITNGTQQTEPFNGYKDQYFGIELQPAKSVSWNVAYYLGQEHPDTIYFPNGGAPAGLPTIQGTPFEPVQNPPNGRLHIFDTYGTWQPKSQFTFGLEGDYVNQRLWSYSVPAYTYGGAVYAQYQISRKIAIAARAEYLGDHGGLFSGTTQALKETTFTTQYKFGEGFLTFLEWRRDFSNQPYFLTSSLGPMKTEQNTATVGLVWWFGAKEGAW